MVEIQDKAQSLANSYVGCNSFPNWLQKYFMLNTAKYGVLRPDDAECINDSVLSQAKDYAQQWEETGPLLSLERIAYLLIPIPQEYQHLLRRKTANLSGVPKLFPFIKADYVWETGVPSPRYSLVSVVESGEVPDFRLPHGPKSVKKLASVTIGPQEYDFFTAQPAEPLTLWERQRRNTAQCLDVDEIVLYRNE